MRKIKSILMILLTFIICFWNVLPVHAEEVTYYLGGFPIGIQITSRGANIISINEIITSDKIISPAENAGLKIGDVILSMDGVKTDTAEDVINYLNSFKGENIILELKRFDEKLIKEITPVKNLDGQYRIGIGIRDDMSGIGTVTFVDSKNSFVALGHPVIDQNNKIVEVSSGKVLECSIYDLLKGGRGKAGELKGIIIEDKQIGELVLNDKTGIHGTFTNDLYKKTGIELGSAQMGNAKMYTCIDGVNIEEFSINIVKVTNNKDNKDLVIKVTDKGLLSKTNGILQGMSGSPIVQNGKLVGAVTHVFVNDPSRGYGISVQKMIS